MNAYIVEAVRTAVGKKNGSLSKWHPADLGAVVLDELVARSGIDAAQIDDVIFGCVSQVGAQGGNIGRMAVLASKLPESVPATSVDRQCGSSLQALHFAAQAVMSGTNDVVIAGGVEVMSLVPIGASIMDGMAANHGVPNNAQGITKRYGDVVFSQFEGAEMVAAKFDCSRAELDKLAFESHRRAAEAIKNGHFKREIVAVQGRNAKTGETVVFDRDEGVRWPADLAALNKLQPLKSDGGRLTAATASQISDGASAVLVVNERGLRKLGLKPRARIVALGLAGDDPVMMLSAPIPATHNVLKRAGLSIKDIGLYEVNEAFASVPLAWAKQVGADLNKLNVNGGAMALGHPLGATGTKLITTLLHEMERRQVRYGLTAICEGGGTANATIIELCTQPVTNAKL